MFLGSSSAWCVLQLMFQAAFQHHVYFGYCFRQRFSITFSMLTSQVAVHGIKCPVIDVSGSISASCILWLMFQAAVQHDVSGCSVQLPCGVAGYDSWRHCPNAHCPFQGCAGQARTPVLSWDRETPCEMDNGKSRLKHYRPIAMIQENVLWKFTTSTTMGNQGWNIIGYRETCCENSPPVEHWEIKAETS